MNTTTVPREARFETVSASQVSGLFGQFACPAKYYFEKIAYYPRKPKASFDIGKAIENAVTHYHVTGTMDTSIFELTIKQLKDGSYQDRFGAAKFGYMHLSEMEKLEYDNDIAEVNHVACLAEYANCVKPMKPIKSQVEIKQELFPGVLLYVYPDYLYPSPVGIRELKTAARSWSESDVKKKIQHIVEVMGCDMEFGIRYPVTYDVIVKTKTPKVQSITVEVTDEDIAQVKNLLWQAVEYKRNFKFVPHERDKTNCLICGSDHSKDFFFDLKN